MNKPLLAARRLALFALICLSAVSVVYLGLRERLTEQKRRALLATFRELAPDDDLPADFLDRGETITVGQQTVRRFRSRYDYLQATTHQGYSGAIELLIALDGDHIKGVRVLNHKETPGLGDKIELAKDPWINGFSGRGRETKFALKKEGGDFDGFSGATITPRAVVHEVGYIFSHYTDRENN